MKKFFLLMCLSACAPTKTEVKAAAYAASIDTVCFMYAVQNVEDNRAREALHNRCKEFLTKAHGGGQ